MKPVIRLLTTLALCLPMLPAAADENALLEETRTVATAMPANLLAVLSDEIASGGLASAIEVCRDKAPAMAKAASAKTGWQIRRVSLKNRNPHAVPDVWETRVLEDFERRAAAGENPATLEHAATVEADGKRVYRYMKALPTQALCLQCHGSSENIPADVQAKLTELYPADKATGYKAGDVRGAITITRTLPPESR